MIPSIKVLHKFANEGSNESSQNYITINIGKMQLNYELSYENGLINHALSVINNGLGCIFLKSHNCAK